MHESVRLPEPVMLFWLRAQNVLLSDSATVPEKWLTASIVMVVVVCVLTLAVAVSGSALIVKSVAWTVTLRIWVRGPLVAGFFAGVIAEPRGVGFLGSFSAPAVIFFGGGCVSLT